MRDPVAPLRLAPFGHPDSGTCWEQRCEERLLQKGFLAIPGLPGVFTHDALRFVLTACVDDFKRAGVESGGAFSGSSMNEEAGKPSP